jgi:protein kinase-like protein/FHA domain-containing protein
VIRLVVESGPDSGRDVVLAEGDVFTVGRDPSASLPLADERASRVHVKLKVKDGVVYIRDMKSRNGTLVNGERVGDVRALRAGDRIQIGDTTLGLAGEAARAPARPAPAPEEEPPAENGEKENGEKTIAGYRITGKLGRGGMGVVYRATQLSLNREVALKILSKKLTQDPTFVEKFIREARAAAQLNHPNVVQVFDVGNENDVYFISMELVSGGTLQALIDEKGKIPASQSLPYAVDAAKALVYAQKKGLVHRDIKPDNLMISEAGVVKIADLGLARSIQESQAGGKGEAGGVFGTPHFVSPEQAQGQKVDGRSDIYSLGATLYTLLAGSTPFHGKTAAEIVSQQIKAQPIPLREIDAEIPEDVSALVAKMMQKNPADRFASAEELLAAMEQIYRAHHYGRRGPGAKIAIAASVLIAGGAVAWVVFQPKPVAPVQANGASRVIERESPELKRQLRTRDAQVAFSSAELFEKDHGRTEETATHYDEVAGKFGDTPSGKAATETAAAIRREVSAARAAAEASAARQSALVEGLRKECAAPLDAGRFATAFASVFASPARAELTGTPREADVQALLADVRTKASDAVSRFLADAEKKESGPDLTDAIERLQPFADVLALPQDVGTEDDRKFFADLVARVGATRTALEKKRDAAEAAVRDHDRDLFYAAAKQAIGFDRALSFDRSAAAIAAIEGQLATQAYRARAKELREESLRIAALLSSLQQAIASGPLHGQEFPLAKETNGVAVGRATGADASGITLEIEVGGGKSAQTISWDAYPPAELLKAIQSTFAKDGASRLALATLGVRLGATREAAAILDEIAKDAASPEAAEAAKLRARATREAEAAEKIAAVRAEYGQGKYRDALRGIEELRAGYSDTLSFLENSSGQSHYVR